LAASHRPLVLWAAFTASFILLQLLPGDAVLIKFLNPELGLGPQEIADIRAAYGADQPVWQQYLHTWLSSSRAISATRCRPACP
jgi:ABC-type dipeptide/oligopeptide/nickel transport system permease component